MVESNNAQTLVLHAGHRKDEATNAVAVPIYQTTSYQFDSTEHAAKLFGLEELGNIYSRIMNPTCAVLEDRVTAIEGGAAGLAVGSGQAASAMSIQNLASAGDNIVSSTDLYGGTWNLFANTLKAMGIETRFVDPTDPEAFRAECEAARRHGFAGKTCIHPSQVDIANAAFLPSPDAVAWSRRILAAAAEAEARGLGAILVDGRMIDPPFLARARAVVALSDLHTATEVP